MREEEKKRSSQGFKRFFKKRWVYPAIYIASAAIILTAVLWYQNSNNATDPDQMDYEATDLSGKKFNEPAIEVNRSLENFAMPVTDPDSVVIQKQFYDYEGTKEEREAALVFYNNTYHTNTGVDITMENGESFDVVASLSGTVTNVMEDALLGNVIEIEHDKGIVTQYQSVTDIDVKIGDEVKKGQTIAKAGKSLYNEEAGTHVHFEIRKDDVPVNPIDYFDKPLSSLQEADVEKSQEEVDNSGKTDNSEGTPDSDANTDDQTEEGQDEGQKEDSEPTDDEGSSETDKDKADDEDSTEKENKADDKESTETEENTDTSDSSGA